MENLSKKFYGMDQNLRNLKNLISDLAVQAREGERKYESKSSDSRRKKKARTYVERSNLPQPSSSRYHDQAIEVSENTSIDTSVTRPYGVSEDNTINIPGAPILRRQIFT